MKSYYQMFEDKISEIKASAMRPTLLLHSCCAPCSTHCLEVLTEYFDVTVFYYNPNITEDQEYRYRVKEQQRYIKEVYGDAVKFIEGDYDTRDYYTAVQGNETDGEGSVRCYKCYKLRLENTCITAKKNGFDYFTSTLSISPYKNSKWLNEIGFILENKYGQKYLPVDFKKKDGYRRSVELSNEYGIYRQDYCGCEFSKRERELKISKEQL